MTFETLFLILFGIDEFPAILRYESPDIHRCRSRTESCMKGWDIEKFDRRNKKGVC